MATSRRAWLAALIVPAVIVTGFTGVVVANAESVSQVRVAQAEYTDAWDHAVTVHERAESALRDAAALALRADRLLYTATTYQGLAHLNPESLAALTPLVAALETALAVELPPSRDLPAPLDSTLPTALVDEAGALRAWADDVAVEWSSVPASTVPDAIQQLESGLELVVAGIAPHGEALLASKAGASAESRTALSDAMAVVAASIADGGATFAAVTSYSSAAQAVVDSQAVADAAAAAAAAAAEAEADYDPVPVEICFEREPIILPSGIVLDLGPACFVFPLP